MRKRNDQQGFILILIPIIIIIILIMVFSSGKKDSNTINHKEQKQTINQSNAESYCQDTKLLEKYLNLNEVSVISVSNYNVQYQDDGSTFDKNGYPIKNLQWTGKDKNTDQDIRFSCWVSGSTNSTTLHWLTLDGKNLYGSANFESFNEDGKKVD